MLTQSELKKIFHYNHENGLFTRIAKCGKYLPFSKVGSLSSYGYLRICINKKHYMAHRLAWLYVYGEFPSKFIDHIDNVRTNNCIKNLRIASKLQNAQNIKKSHKDNKCGLLGVYLHKKSGLYHSRIMINGKQISLGYFKSAVSANVAYIKAKKDLHKFYSHISHH